MKKRFVSIFVLLFGAIFISAQTRIQSADIVVIMDTSGTILPYYDDINKRVLNEINSKFIREGDMFHLISFSANARHEISQQIKSEADLSRIVSRFMLLYQLGQNSDLMSAFDYAKSFTKNLQTTNKEKILIIISDGIFNPPANSKYKNYTPEQLKNKISNIAKNIRSDNWKVYFVKLPFPDNIIIRNLDGEVISGIASKTGSTNKHTDNDNLTGTDSAPFSDNSSGTSSDTSKSTSKNKTSSNIKGNKTSDADNINASSDSNFGSETSKSNIGKDIDSEDTEISSDDSSDRTGTKIAKGETGDRQSSDTIDWDSTSNEDAVNSEQDNIEGSNNTDGYSDISGEVTNSLGIDSSDLSDDEETGFTIIDDKDNLPRVKFPSSLVAKGSKLSLPLKITNHSDEPMELNLESISLSLNDETSKLDVKGGSTIIPPGETSEINASVKLPSEKFKRGNYDDLDLRLNFADKKAVLPQVASLPLSVEPTWFQKIYENERFWVYFGIIAFIILLLLLLLIWLFRRNTSSPVSRAINSVSGSDNLKESSFSSTDEARATGEASNAYAKTFAEQSREEAKARLMLLNQSSTNYVPQYEEQHLRVKRNQSGMTEIYVFNQTRSIGKRNIHVMKPGSQLSVGGGKRDDFIIFLVSFPSNLATVCYDGLDYHLHINKPKYFPYIKAHNINNCIGKTITVVSDKGYHVGFTFREYEDPISNLNSTLTSIDYT